MNVEQNPAEVKRQLWKDWTDPALVAAYRKWYPKLAHQHRRVTDVLLEAAEIGTGMEVLDLASGSGDPAITVAQQVGPAGHVAATDLSPGMIDAARANARAVGMTNMTFQQVDVEALPFANEQFDAVTCRFGIMFFPDTVKALQQIRRVLKPGRVAAFAVWDEESRQGAARIMRQVLSPYRDLPVPAPDRPGPFRFAGGGRLGAVLEAAGFQAVTVQPLSMTLPWPGPPEEYWGYMREIIPLIQETMDHVTPGQAEAIAQAMIEGYHDYYDGTQLNFPGAILLATGRC